jgi:hypothetical protein
VRRRGRATGSAATLAHLAATLAALAASATLALLPAAATLSGLATAAAMRGLVWQHPQPVDDYLLVEPLQRLRRVLHFSASRPVALAGTAISLSTTIATSAPGPPVPGLVL